MDIAFLFLKNPHVTFLRVLCPNTSKLIPLNFNEKHKKNLILTCFTDPIKDDLFLTVLST
jgi:hypothetical protein